MTILQNIHFLTLVFQTIIEVYQKTFGNVLLGLTLQGNFWLRNFLPSTLIPIPILPDVPNVPQRLVALYYLRQKQTGKPIYWVCFVTQNSSKVLLVCWIIGISIIALHLKGCLSLRIDSKMKIYYVTQALKQGFNIKTNWPKNIVEFRNTKSHS